MFNFWPFNVARKRREEAHRQAQERLVAAFREDCQQRAKRNKVIPVIQRDRDAWARHERQSRQRESFSTWAPEQPEVVAQVQQFRCDHPAISEFWQEQQARCDSPTDTSSPSCDAPSTDN